MKNEVTIVIDAHGHLHSCFGVCDFLERASSNLSKTVSRSVRGSRPTCVLFVLSTPEADGFNRLRRTVERGADCGLGSRNWEAHVTAEPDSLCLMSDDCSLVTVAGRQMVSRERLEVLALGTRQQFKEGQPAQTLIQKVAQAGAIPVLPWGVGKWMGARGRVVESLIESSALPPFFLGDNANRPAFWPPPSQFRRAEEQGIRNLSGSDPLPFPEEVQRVGSFGVVLNGALDLDRPAEDLKRMLLDPTTTFRQFGRRETPGRFVRNQLKMQYRKFTQ